MKNTANNNGNGKIIKQDKRIIDPATNRKFWRPTAEEMKRADKDTNIPEAFNPVLDNRVRIQLIAGLKLLDDDLRNFQGILEMYKIESKRFGILNKRFRAETGKLQEKLGLEIIEIEKGEGNPE